MSKANIIIRVDLTNPGQFFACCGLLELADRLKPKAEVTGHFQLQRFDLANFCINSTTTFTSKYLITSLLACRRDPVDPIQPIRGSDGKPVKDPEKTKPVSIGQDVNLRLSWWLDELSGAQTEFKTWSANTTSLQLLEDTIAKVDAEKITDETLLTEPVGMSGRFGLDPRSSWDRLNTGYSPNLHHEVDSYPTTELLAALGLQTFPPLAINGQYRYTPWEIPLSITTARAAASGVINLTNTQPYQFSVLSRGKFKNLSKAQSLQRSNNEQ